MKLVGRVASLVVQSGGVAALYGWGVVVMVLVASGAGSGVAGSGGAGDLDRRGLLASLGSALVVWGVYAIDRVKLLDRWREDLEGPEEGRERVVRHAGRVRVFAALVIASGSVLLGLVAWPLAVLGAVGLGAVFVYAGRAKGFGLKRYALSKNASVAGAFLVLGGSVAWAVGESVSPVLMMAVFGRVLVDAALCDLDDVDADSAAGVTTLATLVGRGRAMGLLVGGELGVVMLFASVPGVTPIAVSAFAIAPLASTIALAMLDRVRVTDVVDARLGVFAVAAVLVLVRGGVGGAG